MSYPISLSEVREKVKRKLSREIRRKQEKLFSYPNIKREINAFGEEIIRVDGDIPIDLPVKNGQSFLFISYDQSSLTHSLHKYPAKFFPELPRWLIRRYSSQGSCVLDPFIGSGTVNLEALLSRRNSVGIDIDPFARFLTKVKTTPINEEELRITSHEILEKLVEFKPELVDEEDIPDFPYRDNWFKKEIILELAYIKKLIQNLDTENHIKDFYRICFSSIIRAVSNADDNCTRTVIRKKLNKNIYPSMALVKFAETILLQIPKMIEFSRVCPLDTWVEIPDDSEARTVNYPDNFFDLALTSPPYVNAVDYPRTHQLEMYWLELVSGSLTPLKKKYIGTENVKAAEYKEFHTIGIKEADEIMFRIFKKDPKRAYITYKYLIDMKENLNEVYRTLREGGRYIIVVGNNRIRGEIFESWKYLIEIAEEVGFKLELYFASEIIRHFIKIPRKERITTDWIIILRK